MAIGRRIDPRVIVAGTVQRTVEREGRESKQVFAHDLTLEDFAGAQLGVRVWVRNGEIAVPIPDLGEFVAYVCRVAESNDYGAELSVERALSEDDLDRIHSSLRAAATV